MNPRAIIVLVLLLAPWSGQAGMENFTTGPAVKAYGPVAPVPDATAIPKGTRFKVAFDVRDAGEDEQPNRTLVTAARFINMHVAAGVQAENIQLAVVVHGPAHRDLLHSKARGGTNPSEPLIEQLLALGVQIHLCGQTAGFYDVTAADLLPGVDISLSAMTSHALLQQQGYTLNPF